MKYFFCHKKLQKDFCLAMFLKDKFEKLKKRNLDRMGTFESDYCLNEGPFIFVTSIFMEIIQSTMPDLEPNCPKCHQKQSLINKYQSLITLLKKKADRTHSSHLSQSQKISTGDLTTSHTSFNGAVGFNRYVLAVVLNKLQQKMKLSALYQLKTQSYIKRCKKSQQFLKKLERICTLQEKHSFNKLKLLTKDSRSQYILHSQTLIDNNQEDTNEVQGSFKGYVKEDKQKSEQELSNTSNQRNETNRLQNSITVDQWNYKSLISVHEDLVTSVNRSGTHCRQESLPLLLSKHQTSTSQQIKNLFKNLFLLEQQNYAYQLKIKNLEHHMQEALSRQIKQNRKKTESLEMVAEEMAEKNQLIAELQQKITMLEEKYDCEANGVLEDELTQHRKEVDKLQKVNIKLDNELRKIREQLAESQSSLQQISNLNSLIEKQNIHLKETVFELEQKNRAYQVKQSQFNLSCKKVEKMLSKLKLEQKQTKFGIPDGKDQKSSIEQFYLLELAFIFLYNIEDESYSFKEHEHLFDEEQLEVLRELKTRFVDMKAKLERKVDLMESIHRHEHGFNQGNQRNFQNNLKTKNGQNDLEDIYCHQSIVDGSIFQVLNDHRDNLSRIDTVPKHSERVEPEKNLTMKLLQMQIEKNKQIEKISELKEKIMYVRNIILNLMKSLELKQNLLKTQTSGILDLIFDVFEYSEEEKQLIFIQAQQLKEKRFFGFI